jgi:hypothetical protein
VERYLRERWRLGIDSRAVRVQPASEYISDGSSPANVLNLFAPTVVPGLAGKEQLILNADPLVEKLKPAAVSIGEGPRWHMSDIDAVVQTFLQENEVGGSEFPIV